MKTFQKLMLVGACLSSQIEASSAASQALLNATTPAQVENALNEGADINARNGYGGTPLIVAVVSKNLPVIKALLKRGAKTTAQTTAENNEGTALMYAIYEPNTPMSIINELLSAPDITQSINLQDIWGNTALTVAIILKNFPAAQAILKANVGAKTTPQTNAPNYNRTALMCAMFDVNDTPSSLPTIYELLQAPDNAESINIRDYQGKTALMYAVDFKSLPAVQALIKAGADVTIKNNAGETALDRAKESGWQPGINLLTKAMNKR